MAKKYNLDLIVGAAFIGVFLLLGLFINNSLALVLTAMAINILFGLSFSMLFSYAGMTSIGHAVYYGMGSYFMMIFIMKCQFHPVLSAVLAIISTTLLSVFLGAVCLRSGMKAFSFLSMGIASTLSALFLKWQFMGRDIGLTFDYLPEWLRNYRVKYYFIVVIVAICSVIYYFVTRTPFCSVAKGIRENEERLRFLGINTQRQRLYIFIVSAFFASIAGVLYTVRSVGAFTAQLETGNSVQAIMMCMVGGTETFFGPIVGAILVTIFVNSVSGYTIYFQGFLGAFVLITVYFIRDGIVSRRTLNWILRLMGKKPAEPKKQEGVKA